MLGGAWMGSAIQDPQWALSLRMCTRGHEFMDVILDSRSESDTDQELLFAEASLEILINLS